MLILLAPLLLAHLDKWLLINFSVLVGSASLNACAYWFISDKATRVKLNLNLVVLDSICVSVLMQLFHFYDEKMSYHGDLQDVALIMIIFVAVFCLSGSRWSVAK